MTLHVAHQHAEPLAGIMALSKSVFALLRPFISLAATRTFNSGARSNSFCHVGAPSAERRRQTVRQSKRYFLKASSRFCTVS